jgi:hypothetical protein
MLKTLRARFMPGQNVSGYAEAATIAAGTFVKVSAGARGGEYQIVKCGAGDKAFGVAESDSGDPAVQNVNSVELRVNVARQGAIARVVPGGTIAQGAAITSDANGKAVTAATGNHINGEAMHAAASTDDFVEVALYYGGISA